MRHKGRLRATLFGVEGPLRFLDALLYLLSPLAIITFIFLMIVINIGLAVFNLIPIPPLDGSKLLYPILPPALLEKYFWLERYGFFILMILVALGVVQAVMGPVVMFFLRLILL